MKSSTVNENQDLFVEVVLPRPFEGTLTYRMTSAEAQTKLLGSWVLVPLGKEKILACIWSINTESELAGHKLRSVLALLQWLRPLPVPLINLLTALSRYYLVPLGEVLTLAMPRWISKPAHLLNPTLEQVSPQAMQGELIFESARESLEKQHIYKSLQNISQCTPLVKGSFPFYVDSREWSKWKKSSSLIELKVPQGPTQLKYTWTKTESLSRQTKLRGTIKDLSELFAEYSEIDHQKVLSLLVHRKELTVKKSLRTLLNEGHLKLSVHSLVNFEDQIDLNIKSN